MTMGHTLVTRFTPESKKYIEEIMAAENANKIPFGRDCDRKEVNAVLEYHMTLLHWAKSRDAYYLERIEGFQPTPCRIRVTGVKTMHAEEGSLLLYFAAEPDQGFRELMHALEQQTGAACSGFLHITLAVSKDHSEILAMGHRIQEKVAFPFTLDIDGLDLYHIWRPTVKVSTLAVI
jgi:2'-5' RNA ligase